MADRVRRQLLGYLIGASDDSERRRIERRLRRDPQWQAELAALRESLDPLRSAEQTFEPPAGLASRTCRHVALFAASVAEQAASTVAGRQEAPRRARRMSAAVVPPSSTATWSWVDLCVAASILVALSLLVFPAVQRNRAHARMMACQDNLRRFGLSLAQLEQGHPELPLSGLDRGAPVNLEPNVSLVLAAVIPVGGARVPDAGPPPLLAQRPLHWLAAPRPGHQGLSSAVWGQNALFDDGRVSFVASGPERPFDGIRLPEPVSAIPALTLPGLAP